MQLIIFKEVFQIHKHSFKRMIVVVFINMIRDQTKNIFYLYIFIFLDFTSSYLTIA